MNLGWDLLLLCFGGLLIVFQFIGGKPFIIGFIVNLYITLFVIKGIIDSIQFFLFLPSVSQTPHIPTFIGGLQVALLLCFLIILFVKAPVGFAHKKHKHWSFRLLLHLIFSFITTSFFLSSFVVLYAGLSFSEAFLLKANPQTLFQGSLLAPFFIQHYTVLFILPSFIWISETFFLPKKETPL